MACVANWTMLHDLPDFEQLLKDDDTYGSPGIPWFMDRYNYLADITICRADATVPCMQGHQLGSMCTSSALLSRGVVNVNKDFQVSEVVYDFLWKKTSPMQELIGKVLFTNLKENIPAPYPQAA